MPQIIMLNHASSVNRQRLDKRMNDKKNDKQHDTGPVEHVETWNGKPITELNTQEYIQYHRSVS